MSAVGRACVRPQRSARQVAPRRLPPVRSFSAKALSRSGRPASGYDASGRADGRVSFRPEARRSAAEEDSVHRYWLWTQRPGRRRHAPAIAGDEQRERHERCALSAWSATQSYGVGGVQRRIAPIPSRTPACAGTTAMRAPVSSAVRMHTSMRLASAGSRAPSASTSS